MQFKTKDLMIYALPEKKQNTGEVGTCIQGHTCPGTFGAVGTCIQGYTCPATHITLGTCVQGVTCGCTHLSWCTQGCTGPSLACGGGYTQHMGTCAQGVTCGCTHFSLCTPACSATPTLPCAGGYTVHPDATVEQEHTPDELATLKAHLQNAIKEIEEKEKALEKK